MATCEIPFTGDYFSISASMEPLKQVIYANSTEGFKLSAVFLPICMVGKSERQPFDGHNIMGKGVVRATCIFRADPHEPACAMETQFFTALITLSVGAKAW